MFSATLQASPIWALHTTREENKYPPVYRITNQSDRRRTQTLLRDRSSTSYRPRSNRRHFLQAEQSPLRRRSSQRLWRARQYPDFLAAWKDERVGSGVGVWWSAWVSWGSVRWSRYPWYSSWYWSWWWESWNKALIIWGEFLVLTRSFLQVWFDLDHSVPVWQYHGHKERGLSGVRCARGIGSWSLMILCLLIQLFIPISEEVRWLYATWLEPVA